APAPGSANRAERAIPVARVRMTLDVVFMVDPAFRGGSFPHPDPTPYKPTSCQRTPRTRGAGTGQFPTPPGRLDVGRQDTSPARTPPRPRRGTSRIMDCHASPVPGVDPAPVSDAPVPRSGGIPQEQAGDRRGQGQAPAVPDRRPGVRLHPGH